MRPHLQYMAYGCLQLSQAEIGNPLKYLTVVQVLDALREVAFEAEFADSRIEKERRAVLSEAGMMNSIEYRVDCQLLGWLHAENALGHRFPIGKTDQVGAPPFKHVPLASAASSAGCHQCVSAREDSSRNHDDTVRLRTTDALVPVWSSITHTCGCSWTATCKYLVSKMSQASRSM